MEKLAIFSEEVVKRNEVAKYYSSNLLNDYKTPYIPNGYISSWAQYSLLAKSLGERDIVIENLKLNNIPIMIYYKIPLHLQKTFSDLGYKKGDFPVSEECSEKIFSIPMHAYLDQNQQDAIIEALKSIEL